MSEVSEAAVSDESLSIGQVALSIASQMRVFGAGEMAALRRLTEAAVVPAYWRLAARHAAIERQRDCWISIIQSLALLTPKGPPGEREDLHDKTRPLGRVLCDGGHEAWPSTVKPGETPQPFLSEQRLAQLLAARGRQRRILLLRAVRMLAAHRDARVGIDVPDLAWRFIDPEPQRLAAPYYLRLDRAEYAAAKAAQAEGTDND